jgi:hypothetical protein
MIIVLELAKRHMLTKQVIDFLEGFLVTLGHAEKYKKGGADGDAPEDKADLGMQICVWCI